ncbi:glycosyltransferase family 9 protein [Candidatus Dormibacter sp.]|uniref:glycosyltransferase family 9 protein n=1 Tax=Candidatus Dormibacter sp. TaxID=2973982 RepID=UPI003D9B1480
MQTSFIGDVILTTPLLARLAADGDVDVVTTPVGATLLASHPAVARLIVYDKRQDDTGPAGFLRVARAARAAGAVTRAYLAQGSTRSAALAIAAGCSTRVGFASSAGAWLCSERVEYRDDWHHARRLLSLAGDCVTATAQNAIASGEGDRRSPLHDHHRNGDDAIRPRLYPTADDIAAVDALLLGQERPFVAVAPGSVWATKRWPKFGELCGLLGEDYDIAIIGGPGDADAAADIKRFVAPARVIDGAGNLSLLGSAEIIRRSLALVTNDSSPQHLASAMGTPTVAIFGPTVPSFGFGPLAPGSRTVGLDDLACRPCDRHGPRSCPLRHWRCMNDITPKEVNDMVRSVITAGMVQGALQERDR